MLSDQFFSKYAIFSKYESRKNPALFFFENEHLNFVELSKYTPRYPTEVIHLIDKGDLQQSY